ncbi:scavenger receptor cysteine-rich type 1 protein M130-like [Anoplopoma fimbria]|uniref:scavenger receptor cysteine-rich type 1 protein M130-like n=1 Tax=Anoplopoma fimbria TaxID=229290 RepID=UPI0023EDA3C5|nr:scavenger receptor cysteine-rich type 1 protein M130-like [Anoplopoma fimbria]
MDRLLLLLLLLLWSSGSQCGTTAQADIVILVDDSSSISTMSFNDIRSFLTEVVSVFEIGPDRIQIGLVQYSGDPNTNWHLNTHHTKLSLLEDINRLQHNGGDTMTGRALTHILHNNFKPEVGMRENSTKIAVLFTDGDSHDNTLLPSQNLKNVGIEIYTLGYDDANTNELKVIASDPDDIHMYFIRELSSIMDIYNKITTNICNSVKSLALALVHQLGFNVLFLSVPVFVRLLNGTSVCSGRLEVKSNQSNQWWSSVCEDNFDQQDAEVVCRELGCGALSVLQGALYGEVAAPMWTKEFQCGGHESALLDCRSSGSDRNTCSPGKAVGLTCSEPVRLVGGSSRCAGTLEVKQGDWRPVEYSDWTLKKASVVCEQLDCGLRNKSLHKSAWEISDNCILSGFDRRVCLTSRSSSSILEITCSDSVRLVNGTSLCSGRLEVKSNRSSQWWSSVCEDDFDQQDAEVVCRELGCGAPSVLQGALYGEVKAPMWTKEFQCGGHESALLDCRSSGSDRNTCSPGKAVGLTCSEPVRLVGGSSRCTGTLEVKQGDWKPVYGSDWTLKAASVVCEQLECSSPISVGRRENFNRSAWKINFNCFQSGSALRECVASGSSSSILKFTCSDPAAFFIRLVVLPLILLLFITVFYFTLKATRGQKPGPQESIELDHYNLDASRAEGGPAEAEGAKEPE